MTSQRMPLERQIAAWMADEAAGVSGAPEALLDGILATTARTTPRPRIVALVAEPTLRTRTAHAAVGLPHRGFVLATVLALALAAVAGLVVGALLLLNPNPRPSETADWPGFRGGADRQAATVSGPAGDPLIRWRIHTTGAVLEVSIAGDRAFFASDDGRLHAVTVDRGIEAWSVEVGEPPLVGPYADAGRLYVADQRGTLRAFREADGGLIWTSANAYDGPSRFVVDGGMIAFGTGDGFVIALEATTGAERWRVRPPGATSVGAPALSDGRVFAGTVGGGYVAIDAATHAIAWAADTGAEVTGSATVADGIAYIGAGPDETGAGSLHAFDAATGRPIWTAADPRLGLPTVEKGVAYTTSTDGRLEALDTATGAVRWSIHLTGDIRPAVAVGGVVYLSGGAANRVYAIEAATGRELWEVPLDGTANCCVSVARGTVFVGTLAGSVTAIGGDGGPVSPHPVSPGASSPSSAPSASVPIAPSSSPSSIPTIASVTRTIDLRGMGFAPVCQIAVDPTTGNVWAPEAETGRIAIFGPDGRLLEEWGQPGSGIGQFDFTRGNGDGYGTLAFARDGSFHVLDVGNLRVQQFDASRHLVRAWGSFGSRPKEYTDPVGIAVAPDGTLWVLDDRRSIVEHYTADGRVLGGFDPFAAEPINNGANSLAIDARGNLYVSGAGPDQVSVFDPAGGLLRVVGKGEFAEQAGAMTIDADGRLFVSQGPDRPGRPGVLVFGPDGALIGGFGPEGSGDGQLVFPGGIALDGRGALYVEDSLPQSARLMRLELAPTLKP